MAMNAPDGERGETGEHLLARATDAARTAGDEPPGGWSVLADDVMRRARTMVRPDQTVLARVAPGGDRTNVSTRVLVAAVRRASTTAATHAPDDVTFRVEGERLRGVEVSLVAAFGVDLIALAEAVRAGVLAELDLLVPGPADDPGRPAVDVVIVDVVDGDPRRS